MPSPSSPWYAQARLNARPEPIRHRRSDLAEQVVRSIGADDTPIRPRQRYVATTRTGEEVSMWSNRPPEVVTDLLRQKIAVAEALAGLPPAEQVTPTPPMPAPAPAVFAPDPLPVAVQPPDVALPTPGMPAAMPGMPTAMPWGWSCGAMPQVPVQAPAAGEMGWNAMNPMAMMSMMSMGALGLHLPRYVTHPCTAPLSDRIERYLSESLQRKSTRQSNTEAKFSLRVLLELTGDKPINQLNVNDVDAFVQAMSVWPPSASKRREFRRMKAPEVVAKARRLGEAPLHTKTQQTHILRVRSFFRWLEKREEIAPGLLRGVRVHNPNQVSDTRRLPFLPEHLERIFSAEMVATHRTPYHYFAPLLAYYQGMRITEIGQMYLDDINLSGDIPMLSIGNGRPGQRVKTEESKRELPIHPMVMACGFGKFVAQAKRWKRVTLFPDIIWSTNGAGDVISDWFNRYFLRKQCGILEKNRTFHSFRHNFGTWARDQIGGEPTRRLMGHRTLERATTLEMFYGDQRPIAIAYRRLQQIPFHPIEHVPYDPAQFEEAFARAQVAERREERLGAVFGTQSLAHGPRIPR